MKEKPWYHGIKKWIFLQSLSKLIVFYGLLLPMQIIMLIMAIAMPDQEDFLFKVVDGFFCFTIMTVIQILGVKKMMNIAEKNKKIKSEEQYKKYFNKLFIITGVILLITYYIVTFTLYILFDNIIFWLISGVVFLVLSFLYLVLLGKTSDRLEKISANKIKEFQANEQN